MKEIVNVSKNWGIGKDGDLLINFQEDMKFFRTTTREKICIMGSTTLESFPGMAPLKNRINIVLIDDDKKIKMESLDAAKAAKERGEKTELIYVHSIDEALKVSSAYPQDDVYVIGGATIYRIMLPYCDECLVTINDCDREADTFYPDLEASPEWEMIDPGEKLIAQCGVGYRFTRWKRII